MLEALAARSTAACLSPWAFLVVISRVARPRAHSPLPNRNNFRNNAKTASLRLSCAQPHQGTLPLSSNDTTYIAHNINTSFETKTSDRFNFHGILGTDYNLSAQTES